MPTALPTIQSVFSVPITKNGSNHTPQFAQTARSIEAHRPAIQTSKALAATALRVLIDDDFYDKVNSIRRTIGRSVLLTDNPLGPRLA